MPILPLDHPEPLAATLGVMLYPAINNDDPRRARAYAAQFLAEPIRRAQTDGHSLSYEKLLRITTDAGYPLTDLNERNWAGTKTGDLFATLFMLAAQNRELASWNNAATIVEIISKSIGGKGARTKLWAAKRDFISVAHLWAALNIRQYRFGPIPEVDYDGYDDFQAFLAEAEVLRDFGQTWRPPRSNGEPPLPADVWRVPGNWKPPAPKPGWPEIGKIQLREVPKELIARLKPSGRPRKYG